MLPEGFSIEVLKFDLPKQVNSGLHVWAGKPSV